MQRLRSTWGARLVACWLLASMLASVCTAVTWGGGSSYSSYANWLRAQLRVPADAALEEALETAAASQARTLDAFLDAFVAAYQAERPAGTLAAAFLGRDLSDDALIAYLESRFQGVGGEGMVPRTTWLSALTSVAKASDRFALDVTAAAAQGAVAAHQAWVAGPKQIVPLAGLLRILSAASPLGP